MISIWFFIGVSLLVNGTLILAAGIYQIANPPVDPGVVLFQLHANVWWGAVLLVIGLFYCLYFRPRRA
jgi:ABC-type transport system involved in multi-copper enzyme maturation permease subunit